MFRLPKCLFSWLGWLIVEAFWLPARALKLGPSRAVTTLLSSLGYWWRVERWRVGFLPKGVHNGGRVIRQNGDAHVVVDIRLIGGPLPMAVLFAYSGGRVVGVFLVRSRRAIAVAGSAQSKMLRVTIDGAPVIPATAADEVVTDKMPAPARAITLETVAWLHLALSGPGYRA